MPLCQLYQNIVESQSDLSLAIEAAVSMHDVNTIGVKVFLKIALVVMAI